MQKLIPVHHSVVDWDFEHGATYRSLSASRYVSAPTSLRFLKPTAYTWWGTVLCRLPATLCLPQGEVRNWVWSSLASDRIATFRNQAGLGSANFTNTYFLHFMTTKVNLVRYLNDLYSLRDSTPLSYPTSVWVHFRIFWYNGKTPGEVPALCVDVYRDIAGEWVKQGSTLYDTANSWKDSATNRAGFIAATEYNIPQYWDDTEIWGPV